ncbi:MAG: lasso RiPP family leader peptide-containing protein [Jatrophihabitantaceae bacterium]
MPEHVTQDVADVAAPYEAPAITDLGTLAELTQGGSGTDTDGSGGANGSSGTI